MNRKYLSIVISALFFVGQSAFALQIPVEIKNEYYEEPTRLSIKISRQGQEEDDLVEVDIPPKDKESKSLSPDVETSFESGTHPITHILFMLFPIGDSQSTALASSSLEPKKSLLTSFSVKIKREKLIIDFKS